MRVATTPVRRLETSFETETIPNRSRFQLEKKVPFVPDCRVQSRSGERTVLNPFDEYSQATKGCKVGWDDGCVIQLALHAWKCGRRQGHATNTFHGVLKRRSFTLTSTFHCHRTAVARWKNTECCKSSIKLEKCKIGNNGESSGYRRIAKRKVSDTCSDDSGTMSNSTLP